MYINGCGAIHCIARITKNSQLHTVRPGLNVSLLYTLLSALVAKIFLCKKNKNQVLIIIIYIL